MLQFQNVKNFKKNIPKSMVNDLRKTLYYYPSIFNLIPLSLRSPKRFLKGHGIG